MSIVDDGGKNGKKRSELIPARKIIANFGGVEVDVYELLTPEREKRLGSEGIGVALGHSKRWFYNRTQRRSEWLDTLLSKGFTGAQQEVKVVERGKGVRGAAKAKTISIRDFTKLVDHEYRVEENRHAGVIALAFLEAGCQKYLESLFAGESVEYFNDKIAHYQEWSYDELEEVLWYNREELASLMLGID